MATYETNLDANAQIFSNANNNATQAYNRAMLNQEGDRLAFDKARFAWQQTLDRAAQTGMFEGAPTQAAMQYYANTFGDWSTPEAGAKTLAAQQQEYTQGVTTAGLTGTYQGQQTQAAAKQAADIAATQAGLTGWLNPAGGGAPGGTQTLAGQNQQWQQGFSEQQQAEKSRQDYLNLLAGLRGPADYGQYLKVLGSTPNGLRDLVSAAQGNYQMGTGVSGQQAVPVSLGSFMNSAATGQGQQYAPGQYAYGQQQPGTNQLDVMPGGGASYSGFDANGQPTGYQQAQDAQRSVYGAQQQQAGQANPYLQGSPAGNNMQPAASGTAYNQYMQQASNLPPPNQIAPQAYNNMTTTQRQMVGGMYEQQGYALPDVADLYKQSLPKYGATRPQVGGFKLS